MYIRRALRRRKQRKKKKERDKIENQEANFTGQYFEHLVEKWEKWFVSPRNAGSQYLSPMVRGDHG